MKKTILNRILAGTSAISIGALCLMQDVYAMKPAQLKRTESTFIPHSVPINSCNKTNESTQQLLRNHISSENNQNESELTEDSMPLASMQSIGDEEYSFETNLCISPAPNHTAGAGTVDLPQGNFADGCFSACGAEKRYYSFSASSSEYINKETRAVNSYLPSLSDGTVFRIENVKPVKGLIRFGKITLYRNFVNSNDCFCQFLDRNKALKWVLKEYIWSVMSLLEQDLNRIFVGVDANQYLKRRSDLFWELVNLNMDTIKNLDYNDRGYYDSAFNSVLGIFLNTCYFMEDLLDGMSPGGISALERDDLIESLNKFYDRYSRMFQG